MKIEWGMQIASLVLIDGAPFIIDPMIGTELLSKEKWLLIFSSKIPLLEQRLFRELSIIDLEVGGY